MSTDSMVAQEDKALLERLRRVEMSGYIRHIAHNTRMSNKTYINPDGPRAATRIEELLRTLDNGRISCSCSAARTVLLVQRQRG